MKNLQIKKVTNEHGVNVYHVEDEGCIQEFITIKEANEYVRYVNKYFKLEGGIKNERY
jgi:hypothetical protein|tara:strand:+ start:537 stop:710 length:174 start_codon:yes stop_codon:yes gene_type:complete